jgi:hypothetical protein
MKTITVHVRESTYLAFQRHARRIGRPTAELIREAMEEYFDARIQKQTSLRDWQPVSAGAVLAALGEDDDLLAEMMEPDDD